MPARLSHDERALLRRAVTHAQANEGRGRKLTEEIIAAGREVVAAWNELRNSEDRMAAAVHKLEELVGKPW
jgi:hypothetical protein